MSGVSVIRHLLANHAGVLAVVPATRIMAGKLPLNTVLPAISIVQVTSIPQNLLRTNEPGKTHVDRVQVTVDFKTPAGTPAGTGYPGLKALMKLLLPACPSQRGVVNGTKVDSIQPDIEGPDFDDDVTAIVSNSRDFIVKWTEG